MIDTMLWDTLGTQAWAAVDGLIWCVHLAQAYICTCIHAYRHRQIQNFGKGVQLLEVKVTPPKSPKIPKGRGVQPSENRKFTCKKLFLVQTLGPHLYPPMIGLVWINGFGCHQYIFLKCYIGWDTIESTIFISGCLIFMVRGRPYYSWFVCVCVCLSVCVSANVSGNNFSQKWLKGLAPNFIYKQGR